MAAQKCTGMSKLFIAATLTSALVYAANNEATQILKLSSSMMYKAPAGNGFIRTFETHSFKSADAQIRKKMVLLATRTCGKKRELVDHSSIDSVTTNLDEYKQEEVLELLDTAEGQRIVLEQLAEEERVPVNLREKRVVKLQTWSYYIPSGKLGGRTKAAVLIARIRNAMANKYVFRLLATALKDGTTRRALTNLTKCPNLVGFQNFIKPTG